MISLARSLVAVACCFASASTLQAQDAEPATDEVQVLVRELADELAAVGYDVDLTGLQVEIMRRAELRKRDLRHIDLDGDPARYAAIVAWLQGLGYWEFETMDEMEIAVNRAIDAEREAFFVPETRLLAVREHRKLTDLRADLRRIGLTHELVHAWRAQVDPDWLTWAAAGTTTEETHIRHSMVEGEAEFASSALALLRQGETIESLADVDVDQLTAMLGLDLFTLENTIGMRFALERWNVGGWGAVRDMWSERPASTEQLLHPAKFGRDLPQDVVLPDWPDDFPAAQLVGSDRLGELETYRMLRLAEVDRDVAQVAAAGWDGDRLALYRTERGETVVVWRTVWDRELDAEQFYAALAEAGDGEWRIEGRVIDWVRSVDGALGARWLAHAASRPFEPATNADDAASTAAVEAEWIAEAELEPYVSGDRWVVPHAGFSVPIPEGWVEDQLGEVRLLTPPDDLHYEIMMITLTTQVATAAGGLEAAMIEASEGAELFDGVPVSSEIIEIEGQQLGKLILEAGDGPVMRSEGLLRLTGKTVTMISVTVEVSAREQHAATIDAIFEGVRFDASEYTRSEVEDEEEPEWSESPEVEQFFQLSVVDALSREPIPNQEVWIATDDYQLYDADAGERERFSRARGKRFLTNAAGEARVSYRAQFGLLLSTRTESGLGLDRTYVPSGRGDGLPQVTLYVYPIHDLEVLVGDAAAEASSGVPIGFHCCDEDEEWRLEEVESSGRGGSHRYEHFLSLLDWGEGDSSRIEVGFAFPQNEVANVVIDPLDPPSEPVRFTSPATGSLLVHVEGVDREKYYDAHDDVELRIREDPRQFAYGVVRSQRSHAKIDTDVDALFTHVGLGLDLEVRADYDQPWMPVSGPTTPGERVEVTIELQDVPESSPWSRDRTRLSTTLLDDARLPAANRSVVWRVSWENGGPTLSGGKSRTDAEGGVSLALDYELIRKAPSIPSVTSDDRGGPPWDSRVWMLKVELWTDDDGYELFWRGDFLGLGSGGSQTLQKLTPSRMHRYLEVHVVDSAGEPVPDAELALRAVDQSGSVADKKRTATWDDVGGTIEFPETSDGCRYLLTVQAPGFRPQGDIEIQAGQESVEVTLEDHEDGVRVEGVLRLPPGRYRDGSEEAGLPSVWVERLEENLAPGLRATYRVQDDELHYSIAGLETGEYKFFIFFGMLGDQVEMMKLFAEAPEPVMIARPESGESSFFAQLLCADPGTYTLEPVDLREHWVDLELTVVDESGEPISDRVRVRTKRKDGAETEYLASSSIGVHNIRTIADEFDLIVSADGYRSALLHDPRSDTRVVLRRGLQLRIVAAPDLPELEANEHIELRLSIGADSERLLPAVATKRVVLQDGVALIDVSRSGEWSLDWYLEREVEGSSKSRRIGRRSDVSIQVRDVEEEQEIVVAAPSVEDIEKTRSRFR